MDDSKDALESVHERISIIHIEITCDNQAYKDLGRYEHVSNRTNRTAYGHL